MQDRAEFLGVSRAFPVSHRRRWRKKAARALGGVTGRLRATARSTYSADKKPPARVSYGKQSTGLFFYFPALRLRYARPWSSAPHLASFLSQKAGQRTFLGSPRLGRAAAALENPGQRIKQE